MKFCVIGDPIAHSLSPVMHRAAFAAMGLDHTYDAERVEASALPALLDRVRRGSLHGINVTIPHKVEILSLVDVVSPEVARIGAANTVLLDATGRLVAHNTDAPGLRADLIRHGVTDPDRALVLGTGGAARAAIVALQDLAQRVGVCGRDEGKARSLSRALGVDLVTQITAERPFDLVVNATSLGMDGGPDGAPLAEWLALVPRTAEAFAYDLVVRATDTPFVAAGRPRAASGVGMLVEQGVRALALFLSRPIPDAARDAMYAALLARMTRES